MTTRYPSLARFLRSAIVVLVAACALAERPASGQRPTGGTRGPGAEGTRRGSGNPPSGSSPREVRSRARAAMEEAVARMSLDEVKEAYRTNPRKTQDEQLLGTVQHARIERGEAQENQAKESDELRERFQKRAIMAKQVAKLDLAELRDAHAANPRRTEDDQMLWEEQRRRIRMAEGHARSVLKQAKLDARNRNRRAMEDAVAKLSLPDLRAALEKNPHRDENERVLWLVQQHRLEEMEKQAEKQAKRAELEAKRAEMKAEVAKLSIPELESALRANPRKTPDERMLWYVQRDRLGEATWEALSPAERKQIQDVKEMFFLAALEALSNIGTAEPIGPDGLTNGQRAAGEERDRQIRNRAYEESQRKGRDQ